MLPTFESRHSLIHLQISAACNGQLFDCLHDFIQKIISDCINLKFLAIYLEIPTQNFSLKYS